MKPNRLPQVTFYRVTNNGEKLQLICARAQAAIKRQKRSLWVTVCLRWEATFSRFLAAAVRSR